MEVRGLLKHIREREDQLFLVLTLVIGAVVARARGLVAQMKSSWV